MTNFEHDIFISYAHIDNETMTDEQEGWVDMLHRALEIRLAQLLGNKPKIWRDPTLRGIDEFNEEIVDELVKAAILVSILSPRYVTSDWCIKEINQFAEFAEQSVGLRLGNKSRIVKVVKTDIPRQKHPSVVQGVLGYDFYEVDPKNNQPREFNRGFGSDIDPKYWARLDDLAYDIRDLLEILRAKYADTIDQPDQPKPLLPESSGYTIYLAETTFDRQEDRDKIRRELETHHHTVLPNRKLPLIGPELEQVVKENLEQCDLAIHLIGENYGLVPEAAKNSVVEMQNTIAAEYGKQLKFGRIVWLPPDLDLENLENLGDERQKAFVEALQNDPLGADLFHTSIEDLKTNVHQKLNPPEPAIPKEDNTSAAATSDGPPVVYLIFDPADEDNIWDIHDHLIEQGIDVDLFVYDGDEAEVRREHQVSLRDCDAVLVYHGQASDTWLKGKLSDLKKIAGYGRVKPMASQAIYIAPPKTPRKEHFKTLQIDEIIKNFEDFKPEHLDSFLAKVKPITTEEG